MSNTTGIKFGGRTKGTPNKQTKEIREAYKLLIENNLDNLTKWINEIANKSPEKAIDIIIKLSEYVVPKLNRTEIQNEEGDYIKVPNLTREERDEKIKEMVKEYIDSGGEV